MTNIVRASIAARTLGITVDTVLKLAGKPDYPYKRWHVDLDAIEAELAKEAELANKVKKFKKTGKAKEPVQEATRPAAATRPDRPVRPAAAQEPRETRAHGNDTLTGVRTTPRDREILKLVQEWANSFRLPANFKPILVPEGDYDVSYVLNGRKVVVPAALGAQIKNGIVKVENPKPPFAERMEMAKLLASLSFLSPTCEVCGEPLSDNTFESGIHGLLEGRFVLPKSGYMPDRTMTPKQGWYSFRSADLVCRMIEMHLQDWVTNPDLGAAELEKMLIKVVPHILADCRVKRPGTKPDDVLNKLQVVLDFLGGKK